jgi:RHS repeat-associated protein
LSNDDINGLGCFKNQLDSIGNSVTGFETAVAIVRIAVASFETAVVNFGIAVVSFKTAVAYFRIAVVSFKTAVAIFRIAVARFEMVVASGPALYPMGGTATVWLISKYDIFGRVVYTGWSTQKPRTSQGRKQLVDEMTTDWSEQRTSNTTSLNGVAMNYTHSTLPSVEHLLTITYYDDYNYAGAPTSFERVEDQVLLEQAKSLTTGTWTRVLTRENQTYGELAYQLYDLKSRVVRSYKQGGIHDGFTQIDTKLDFVGKPLYTITTHKRKNADDLLTVRDEYEYNEQDRLVVHVHKVNDEQVRLLAKNEYDNLGQLMNKRVGGEDVTNFEGLQKVDYNYNIRGWLRSINNVSSLDEHGDALDLFAFKINYNQVENNVNYEGKPLYNGNISETYWRTGSDDIKRKYGYFYDALNRLTEAIYQKPNETVPVTNSYNESLSYDKNGNIISLIRNGEFDDANYALEIDNLTYTYNPDKRNQLMNLVDSSNNPNGFKDDTNPHEDYQYDDNGNMIVDANKGIAKIDYNHLNLPTEIEFANHSRIEYLYNATGQKIKKVVYPQTGSAVETEYLDGFQYSKVNDTAAVVLDFFPHAEGYVKVSGENTDYDYSYVYNYLDHLGNVRLSYGKEPNGDVVKILEENNYYPFGMKHNNYNIDKLQYEKYGSELSIEYCTNCSYKYKYNGKEWQDELGLNEYDYGARGYMPDIVRWRQIDPMAEKGRRWSPYVYAFNSPVFFIDPDGMWPDPPIGFNASLRVSFGSNGLSFKANASIGVGGGGSNLQGVAFAGVSVYAGNQLGTSSMARGVQFDATAGAYATLGSGSGNSHVVNTLNPDTPSGITNNFSSSVTYGQMFTFSSAINAERGPNDGGAVQRLGMVGLKAFDVSLTTSNDTAKMGGGGTDKGQTGNGTLNIGGENGFSVSYMNYTGSYDTSQEPGNGGSVGFGSYYQQTPYQQSLNQSAFRIDALGTSVIGGTSNGSIQNAIHSVTNTGLFSYPNTTTDTSNLFNLLYNR